MYKGKTLSVVMPAYNEEKAIYQCVSGFISLPEVDKVVVANNNSKDNTAKLASEAGAVVINEPRQGYGFACRKALDSAETDIIILTESDGTFNPLDVYKLLAYMKEFDIVKGARSSKVMISKDAHWTPFLKYGNYFVSKIIQLLYGGPHMAEAGGTFRMIKREAWKSIRPYVTENKSAFLPDMVTIALRKNLKILEIPINYKNRGGVSKITGNFWSALKLGLRMIKIILINRFKPLR